MAAQETLRERLEREFNAVKAERDSGGWISHWRELCDYILPRRGRFLVTDRNKGDKRNTKIINNTPTRATRILASGMQAGLTSPARPWFRLVTPDPDLMRFAPVKRYLGDVERILRLIFARSNFYNAIHTAYEELGVFGTQVMVMIEDFDTVLRCHTFTVGEYSLANSERGTVNTCFRELSLTVRQLVERFGNPEAGPNARWDNFSVGVKDAWDKGNYHKWVDVVHAIVPNPAFVEGSTRPDQRPYLSVYWEVGESDKRKVLQARTFSELPILASRWHLMPGDIYGRSPGMDVLGDAKQLQTQEKRKAEIIDKHARPPMVGGADLANRRASILPGDITYVDTTRPGFKGFEPAFQTHGNPGYLIEDIRETERRIMSGFYADLFLMIASQDQQMTATEVVERKEEKLIQLGPVIERQQDELLDPAIDRAFAIALRAGILPEPPQELQGQDIDVEYLGLLAQAQKLVSISGLERTFGFIGNLAGIRPDAIDKIDIDEAIDEYADATGVPPRIIRSTDEANQIRAQRAQQQAMAAAVTQAAEAAKAAELLSRTDTARENALTQLMGTA